MLDGVDLVTILLTGAGKTGYFTMFMLVLVELSHNSSLSDPPVSIPRDPCMIVVYPTNGLEEEQAFHQLGHARTRLPPHVFIGMSATVLAGDARGSIFAFLGLYAGKFHLIQRSNLRQNVQTIFQTLTHGIGGWSFPDLKWIIESKHKTVIHCRTIALGFWLALYLWRLLPSHVNRNHCVRLYYALNWAEYNAETRQLMREDPEAQIVIATAAFMVGIDLPNIHNIVLLGTLESADEHVLWQGQAGRDKSMVADA
ncbi:hypothetical protein GSI_11695 [Ganoderma sinense ZZ0214-1]|uniref:Helicase C-terminal domain-containing protein n=1 Tax=Ganoderma sinense ZZ0214-1 TaxID=1077348 RepID=A0A2G8RWP7_9APHY|nr:hypothetical protein GSI_11695 [Ganoderma sinense ZZ0214-1]